MVWAFMGYRLSENDRKMLGRTPWGLPSALWAFFWFLSLLLGLVLYLIAHSIGVRQAQRNPPVMNPGGTVTPPSMEVRAHANRQLTAAEQFPAYPRPANFQPEASDEVPAESESAPEHGGVGSWGRVGLQPTARSLRRRGTPIPAAGSTTAGGTATSGRRRCQATVTI